MEQKEELTVNIVHDLTEEELILLDALRDPLKGAQIRAVVAQSAQE